jgi:hypothetical protein
MLLMPVAWSNIEVELIVADYFNMLIKELAGKGYSKADHRKNLLPLLNDRSEGSIEFKHQNISAVLVNLGQPYIKGYLPRYNYQMLLEDKVLDYLIVNINLENKFEIFANKEVNQTSLKVNFENIIVEPPKVKAIAEPLVRYQRNPINVNYLEREQNNNKLGRLGEEIVFQFEKWNLIKAGKEKLAEKVEWVSKEQGDGAGFDILSKYSNGTDKYIEVKATKLSKEAPFFFTGNELQFSLEHAYDFHLYRLFNLEEQVKMFIKKGDLTNICHSEPMTYKGYF